MWHRERLCDIIRYVSTSCISWCSPFHLFPLFLLFHLFHQLPQFLFLYNMVSSNFLCIFKVSQELNWCRTIPATYWNALKEHLSITFKPSAGRLKRGKTPCLKEDYRLHYKKKKAQKVYLEILEDYPHIYIPFILAIPPKSCEKFDLGVFRRNYDLTGKIDLRDDARTVLEDIATKEGFNQNRLYQLLMQSIFPRGLF